MGEKYLCIHGHFYQPPRENPWLDAIEYQSSAHPFHDWNERITRECYGPNTRARLHTPGGGIITLINNYEYMSFNFGPTLLSWLEKAHPWIYSQILAADRASMKRYQGHGNALAQVYNHLIMPLAGPRDKVTQIRWGLADFKHRFGRRPEGMWLAETAVDSTTLDLMAREGIKFTILSPDQAHRVRPLRGKGDSWQDVSGGRIDPTRPYRVHLDPAGGRFMDIFFYHGPVSRAVAYEKILASGEDFLSTIQEAFGAAHSGRARLISIATDGESYGHHFKFGDLTLAWLFHHLEETGQVGLTNYGLFLERFPPEYEVKIFENSSWSCAHGVERWRGDCGCCVAPRKGWNQSWRAPLRQGLDWLAQELAITFEQRGARLLKDIWQARDDYVRVLLNPSDKERDRFLRRHASASLTEEENTEIFSLMESQRMALYMFTSCGWFFDDISGLEATQVLKYAARAIDLVRAWSQADLEGKLLGLLSKARCNERVYQNGRRVYEALVKPARVDPSKAAAHYAFGALCGGSPDPLYPFLNMVHPLTRHTMEANGLRALVGQVQTREVWTGKGSNRTYLALSRHDKDLLCMVGKELRYGWEDMVAALSASLKKGGEGEMEDVFHSKVSEMEKYFFTDLLSDTREHLLQCWARNIARPVRAAALDQAESLENLLSLIQSTGHSAPPVLQDILRLAVTEKLKSILEEGQSRDLIDWPELFHLVAQGKIVLGLGGPSKETPAPGLTPNDPRLRPRVQAFLRRHMERLASQPEADLIHTVIQLLDLARELDLPLDLWECQNRFFELDRNPQYMRGLKPEVSGPLKNLGHRLGFRKEDELD